MMSSIAGCPRWSEAGPGSITHVIHAIGYSRLMALITGSTWTLSPIALSITMQIRSNGDVTADTARARFSPDPARPAP
jgi:hypothetical protein